MHVFKDFNEYKSLITIYPRVGRLFYVSVMAVHTLTINGIVNCKRCDITVQSPRSFRSSSQGRSWHLGGMEETGRHIHQTN